MNVKNSKEYGCTFLGKGIVGRPEMGVVVQCREVIFDEWDVMRQDWKGHEVKKLVFKTDTGYVFDEDDYLGPDARLEIELYAPNWRAKKGGINWN